MLGSIKQEVGMFKWPVSNRHVDIVLSHHFIKQTNSEIQRLNLPALAPLAKRQRMSHVNETAESKVGAEILFLSFNTLSLNTLDLNIYLYHLFCLRHTTQ